MAIPALPPLSFKRLAPEGSQTLETTQPALEGRQVGQTVRPLPEDRPAGRPTGGGQPETVPCAGGARPRTFCCTVHHGSLLPLRPASRSGASEEALDHAERELGVALPPTLRALYRVHNGQQLEFDLLMDAHRTFMHKSLFHGLFGG